MTTPSDPGHAVGHQAAALIATPLPRQRRAATATATATTGSPPPLPATAADRVPNLIAITGGKGGIGKTMIAVNLAILAQRNGYRTLLVDLDPGLANVDVHLRLAPSRTLADVVEGRFALAEAVCPGPAGLDVLAGCHARESSGVPSGANHPGLATDPNPIAPAPRPRPTGAAHSAGGAETLCKTLATDGAHYDCIIADTGAGIGPSVLETIRRAALPVLVTTPDPAALTDAYAVAKLLHRHGGAMPRLVINHALAPDHGLRIAGRFQHAVQRFLGHDVPLAGVLTRDATLERSVLEQRPAASNGLSARSELGALAADLLSNLPRRR